MFKRSIALFIFTVLIIINPAHAKIRGDSILDGLRSKVLSEQRDLIVYLPNNYQQHTKMKYPVMYLLDGQRNFHHAVGSLDLLNQSYMAQEMIIVAIKNTQRTRDFTPTYDESYNRWGKSGGADNFLDFLEQELVPYINAKYRTNNFKVISGHSLSALFTVYALQSRPKLFQAYFAFSPSLWWHNEIVLKQAKTFFATTNTVGLNRYLYINMANESGAMLSAFEKYTQLVRTQKASGLIFESALEKTENHSTSALVGQTKAYRFLYRAFECPQDIVVQGLQAIEQYYRELSKIHGYLITPSYRTIRTAAYQLLNNNEHAKAIELFELNVKNHPNIPDSYSRLAYSLEADDQLGKALQMVNIALLKGQQENVELNSFKHHKVHLEKLITRRELQNAK